MSYYGVSAVRLDAENTKITHVMWEILSDTNPMEYIPTEAPVIDVVNALISGDHVILITQDESGTWINTGAEFKPFTDPDGVEGITNNKIALDKLPTF